MADRLGLKGVKWGYIGLFCVLIDRRFIKALISWRLTCSRVAFFFLFILAHNCPVYYICLKL